MTAPPTPRTPPRGILSLDIGKWRVTARARPDTREHPTRKLSVLVLFSAILHVAFFGAGWLSIRVFEGAVATSEWAGVYARAFHGLAKLLAALLVEKKLVVAFLSIIFILSFRWIPGSRMPAYLAFSRGVTWLLVRFVGVAILGFVFLSFTVFVIVGLLVNPFQALWVPTWLWLLGMMVSGYALAYLALPATLPLVMGSDWVSNWVSVRKWKKEGERGYMTTEQKEADELDEPVIAAISDTHFTEHGGPGMERKSKYNIMLDDDCMLDHLSRETRGVSLILHPGDITDDGSDGAWERAFAGLTKLGCPVVACPGNHDVNFRQFATGEITGPEQFDVRRAARRILALFCATVPESSKQDLLRISTIDCGFPMIFSDHDGRFEVVCIDSNERVPGSAATNAIGAVSKDSLQWARRMLGWQRRMYGVNEMSNAAAGDCNPADAGAQACVETVADLDPSIEQCVSGEGIASCTCGSDRHQDACDPPPPPPLRILVLHHHVLATDKDASLSLVNSAEVLALAREFCFDLIVHGHRHFPAQHILDDGLRVISCGSARYDPGTPDAFAASPSCFLLYERQEGLCARLTPLTSQESAEARRPST